VFERGPVAIRTRQPVQMHGSNRAGGRTIRRGSVTQKPCATVGSERLLEAAVGSVVEDISSARTGHRMCRYSFFLAAD